MAKLVSEIPVYLSDDDWRVIQRSLISLIHGFAINQDKHVVMDLPMIARDWARKDLERVLDRLTREGVLK